MNEAMTVKVDVKPETANQLGRIEEKLDRLLAAIDKPCERWHYDLATGSPIAPEDE